MSDSMCSYFWNHLCVRQNMQVKPCCVFDMGERKWPVWNGSVDFIANNPLHAELRSKAVAGERIKGCERCYSQEEAGLWSLRNLANRQFPLKDKASIAPNIKVRSLELFLGDLCNLKCVMCAPNLSTKLREDYLKLNWKVPKRVSRVEFSELISVFSNLEEVKFVGGEPLIIPEHQKVIDELSLNEPEKIKLLYSTNVTIFPSTRLVEQWKRFGKVTLLLSIDGVGKVNEFIRYPSKWEVIEENFIKFLQLSNSHPNIEVYLAPTVSILNIWNISELEDWFVELRSRYLKNKVSDISINILSSPEFLSIKNIHGTFRNSAIESLNSESEYQKGLKKILETSQVSSNGLNAVSHIRSLERIRTKKMGNAAPYLEKYIQYLESL